jgi:hypothetical protein
MVQTEVDVTIQGDDTKHSKQETTDVSEVEVVDNTER